MRGDLEAEVSSLNLNVAHFQHGRGIASIKQNCQPAQTRDNLTQEFEPLAVGIVLLDRQPSDVTARMRKARDEADANRIVRDGKDDGDGSCRLLECESGGAIGNNHVCLLLYELRRGLCDALGASFREARLDHDRATLDPAEFA